MCSIFYPEDARFYYMKIASGKRCYRFIVNDRVVARKDIPKSILGDIKLIEDIKFDNSKEISDHTNRIETLEGYIEGYKKYISKLEEDLAEMEIIDIPEGDPRNYYYKRKIGNNRPVVYAYRGYVSAKDIEYKRSLVGDTMRGKCVTGKSFQTTVPVSIIDDIKLFDEYYLFISKRAEIDSSISSIKKIEESIININEKIRTLRETSGDINREDLIREYYILKGKYDEDNKVKERKIYDDIRQKDKYNSFVYPEPDKIWMKAQKMEDIEKKRKEMLKKKLEEERARMEEERSKAEEARKQEELNRQQSNPFTFLKSLNITDKTSWKRWLLKHHSDRAGPQNARITQQVIDAGRAVGY